MYKKVTIPNVVRVSDHIVTVSEFSRQDIIQTTNTPHHKISAIYNGIDPLFINDGGEKKIDLPENYLIFVGSSNPRKNLSGAIEAFRQAHSMIGSNCKFVIIGPKNKMIFDDLDIPTGDDIITPGFMEREELKYAYKNADLFLYPSFYEGFGLPPLEAAACGTPVLVSNIPPFTETFSSDSAEFVNPESTTSIAEGITNVLTDQTYRQRLAIQGMVQARQWTWENSIKRLKLVFEKLK